MNVTREMLMAYVDGELDQLAARRVAQAIAEDSDLARRFEEESALRAKLQSQFAPLTDEPIPSAWTEMIAAAAEEDGKVVSLAEAREGRSLRGLSIWGSGIAIAASLVLGLMLGTQLVERGPVAERNGSLVAAAGLARALDTQLSSDHDSAAVRMLVSFRRDTGDYCRVFSGKALSGIACREDEGWRLEQLIPRGKADVSQYRQADSADAGLMAVAQDMAAGEALDAEQEAAARAKGWR